jgi:hypothetical protein
MFIYIQIKLFLVKSYECYLYPISNDSINKSTRFVVPTVWYFFVFSILFHIKCIFYNIFGCEVKMTFIVDDRLLSVSKGQP